MPLPFFDVMKGVLMFLRKNIDKETIEILSKENKRLRRENYRLRESLNELDKYKTEYKKLIKKLNCVKSDYVKKIKAFDDIEKEYCKKLNEIVNNKAGGLNDSNGFYI